jgi:hypothetical protein
MTDEEEEEEEVEDVNQRTPRPSSPCLRSEHAPNTEALPEETGEARSKGVDKADDAEEVQEAAGHDELAQQQESSHLLEEGILEEANVHAEGRYALPTWAAVLRDYGRMVSRRVVYGVAVVM